MFIALKTFTSPEVKSVYTEGLSYTILPNNKYLNALAEVWKLEGKISFVAQPTSSSIKGHGFIEPTIWHKTKMIWDRLWQ